MTSGFKTMVFALCVGVAACGSSNNTGGGITITDGGSEAATGNDAATGSDGSTTGNDGSTTGRDGSTTGNDAATTDRPAGSDGGTSMYGTCGQSVVQALCACGPMDGACQGRALQMSMACVQCYGQAITGCCPTQAMELTACGQRVMCQTDACLQTMCRTEYMALNTCFISAQQNDMACQRRMAACFGAFPPACM